MGRFFRIRQRNVKQISERRLGWWLDKWGDTNAHIFKHLIDGTIMFNLPKRARRLHNKPITAEEVNIEVI